MSESSRMILEDFLIIFTILCLPSAQTATYDDVATLHSTLLANYNRHIRPKSNQSQLTEISITLMFKSLTSFDEINGVLSTVSAMYVQWVDEKLTWNPSDHSHINSLKIEENLIWIPDIIISNPASKIEKLGLPIIEVQVYNNGFVNYVLGDIMHTTCHVDVTVFPFDTQNCFLEFMPFGYSNDSVKLASKPVDLTLYTENNVWILKSTSSKTEFFTTLPYMKVTLTLERRYAFFILNLFSPVLILVVLNAMVFVLPAEGGERVGYAITCLLSLSLYMTLASENLPSSSKPVAMVIYILMFYMLISTLICFGTIIGLQLHRYGDTTPHPYVLKVCCFKCKTSKVEQSPDADNLDKFESETERVTWKDIAKIFDKVCCIVSILFVVLASLMYLLSVLE